MVPLTVVAPVPLKVAVKLAPILTPLEMESAPALSMLPLTAVMRVTAPAPFWIVRITAPVFTYRRSAATEPEVEFEAVLRVIEPAAALEFDMIRD